MNNNTESQPAQSRKSGDNRSEKGPDDFIVGLVTFIAFIIFMTAWMYFAV
jgi:hypothetical protein